MSIICIETELIILYTTFVENSLMNSHTSRHICPEETPHAIIYKITETHQVITLFLQTMSRVLVFTQPYKVGFEDYEDRSLKPDEIRLRTLYSGISAGTELTAYRGSNPYLHKHWDPDRRLFFPAEQVSLSYPISGWGYEEVGEVIELGADVEGVTLGDVVYGIWGHRTHHIIETRYAHQHTLPKNLEPIFGVFHRIGAIALNGVHDARIRIGETVVVFGLGTLGQIVGQLACQSGSRVIGVDLLEMRLELAQSNGAVDVALNAHDGEVAERIRALTGNNGADVAIEVSGSTTALNEAVRSVAYSARVIALGFYQGESGGLYLGEEFHHNRVNIVCSQISGTNPELTYRWNQQRLAQTFMDLQANGVVNLQPIISHVIPFEHAAEAFQIIDEQPEEALQVILQFT
jgi:2-desacetyl-2-hydroxyethyl bacteriochlorophyllide A dehydrogenase